MSNEKKPFFLRIQFHPTETEKRDMPTKVRFPDILSRIIPSLYESGRTLLPYTLLTHLALAIYRAVKPTIKISHPPLL